VQNGKEILLAENMFLSHRVSIRKGLLNKAGEKNVLRLEFESAWLRGKREEAENGGKLGLCTCRPRSSPTELSLTGAWDLPRLQGTETRPDSTSERLSTTTAGESGSRGHQDYEYR
jgi:hypothetical protein